MTQMQNHIKFYPNKTYIYFFILLMIGVFLLDGYSLIFGKPTGRDVPPMVTFGTLFFLVAIFLVRKFVIILKWCRLPALELNENELIDHIENIRIPWNNVSDIRLKNIGRGFSLVVQVKDENEVLHQKNAFSRFFLRIRLLISGGVAMSLGTIEGRNQDIFNKVYEFYKAVREGKT